MSTKTEQVQFELAAKAAGVSVVFSDDGTCYLAEMGGNQSFRYRVRWNPRDDDGDALRLAVVLNMRVGVGQVDWAGGDWVGSFSEPEEIADDSCAATRLAIFNTAVDIGEAMP